MGLFKPPWMSRNAGTASKAVSKTEDEATLIRIVREAQLVSASLHAARKLSDKGMCDEGYWRELASSHGDRDVRILAAGNVDDVDFLADFLSKPENLGADGSPDKELSRKLDEAVNKAKLDAAEAYKREIAVMEDRALLSQIASMDNEAVEERFGRFKLGYLPGVRERALARLVELGGDGVYRMLARDSAVDGNVALHVVRDIEDDQLLYRIASDSKARRSVRVAAVGTTWHGKTGSCQGIADIDLLGKLATLPRKTSANNREIQGDAEVREAASRKLCSLPCRDGQLHEWHCVSDDVREVGASYVGTRRYRCSKCGNEHDEDVSERY